MTLDRPYRIALGVLRTTTSFVSVVGSLMVMSQVSRSKFNRSKPQQRLVLGMVTSDFIATLVVLLGNLFVPASSDTDLFLPVGNFASCQAQGFLIQLGSLSGIVYAASLQLQYLLTIRFAWKEPKIRKIEPFLHGLPLSLGLGTAVASFPLALYNPAQWNCWIARLPQNCTASHEIRNGHDTGLTESNCIRGDNADLYRLGFFYGPLWLCFVFCIIAMFWVYKTVRGKEVKSREYIAKFARTKSQIPKLHMTKEVAKQSLLYAGAFVVSWTFPSIVRVMQHTDQNIPQILIVLAGTTSNSLVGFFNALIYFSQRYKKLDHRHWWQKVWSLLSSTLFFCGNAEDYTHDDEDYIVAPIDSFFTVGVGTCRKTWQKVTGYVRQMTPNHEAEQDGKQVVEHERSDPNGNNSRVMDDVAEEFKSGEISDTHYRSEMDTRQEEKVEEEFEEEFQGHNTGKSTDVLVRTDVKDAGRG
ncbi:hypothetical protein ACHAWF_009868 [Thalassiosira exigua]